MKLLLTALVIIPVVLIAIALVVMLSGGGEASTPVFEGVSAEGLRAQNIVVIDFAPRPEREFPRDFGQGLVRAGAVLDGRQLVRVNLTFKPRPNPGGWVQPTGEHLAWAMRLDISQTSGLAHGDVFGPVALALRAGADITIVFVDADNGQTLANYQHFPGWE